MPQFGRLIPVHICLFSGCPVTVPGAAEIFLLPETDSLQTYTKKSVLEI